MAGLVGGPKPKEPVKLSELTDEELHRRKAALRRECESYNKGENDVEE